MRRGLLIVPLLASSCAFQSASKLDEPVDGYGVPSTLKLDDAQEVRGRLEAMGPEGELVVDTEDGPVRIEIDESSTAFRDGKLATLAELPEGSPVRASVRLEGDRRVLGWIEVPRSLKKADDGEHRHDTAAAKVRP